MNDDTESKAIQLSWAAYGFRGDDVPSCWPISLNAYDRDFYRRRVMMRNET